MSEVRFGDSRLPERFWAKVQPEPNSGCWLWTAAADPMSYGRYMSTSPQGPVKLAHRVAYIALTGHDPIGLHLDHLCRTPACVNPLHLEAVPHAVNVRRGVAAARTRARHASVTHCPVGHPYSAENTYHGTIRRSDGRTYPSRRCKTCRRAGLQKAVSR
jgi:hypothetical protein